MENSAPEGEGDPSGGKSGPEKSAADMELGEALARFRRLSAKLWRAIRSPGEELSHRVVHGGLWQVLQKVASRGVGFVRTVVLARLLAPEDFGLFGIALLTQQSIDVLLRIGVDDKLIHEAEDTEGLLDTAWTIKVVKAVVVAGGLLLTAPYVAGFFDAPRATPLIQVLSAVVLIQGLQNIGVVYFRKELEMSKQFALNFSSSAMNLLVAVPAAIVLGSAWALLIGMLAAAATTFLLSYTLHDYRPALEFSRRKLEKIVDFGKWIFGSSTLNFASVQGDDILLGRWLGAASLGVYQVAYRISNAVATEVTHVISGVTFPAYAKLQSRPDRMRDGFLATLSVTAMIVVPLAAAVVIFIPDFVRHVIGTQWTEAIGPVRILALAGLLRAFSACWGPLYLARGQTDRPFWKQLVRALLTLGPAYPLTVRYGIEGMSLSVLAGITATLAYDLWWSGMAEEVGIGLSELWRASAEPVAATLLASALVLSARQATIESLSSFVALAVVFIAAYGAIILGMERRGRRTGVGELASLMRKV